MWLDGTKVGCKPNSSSGPTHGGERCQRQVLNRTTSPGSIQCSMIIPSFMFSPGSTGTLMFSSHKNNRSKRPSLRYMDLPAKYSSLVSSDIAAAYLLWLMICVLRTPPSRTKGTVNLAKAVERNLEGWSPIWHSVRSICHPFVELWLLVLTKSRCSCAVGGRCDVTACGLWKTGLAMSPKGPKR